MALRNAPLARVTLEQVLEIRPESAAVHDLLAVALGRSAAAGATGAPGWLLAAGALLAGVFGRRRRR